MSDREEGFYWVKHNNQPDWEVDCWLGDEWMCAEAFSHDRIGPRIPSPDEPWVTVPVEATQEMQNAGSVARYHERKDCKGVYHAMTSAAPKPGDEQ